VASSCEHGDGPSGSGATELVGSLVRCWSFAVSDFGRYTMFMTCVCYNRCHGNAAEEYLGLWDNIYDHACLLF
jgi:hypothetical protein